MCTKKSTDLGLVDFHSLTTADFGMLPWTLEDVCKTNIKYQNYIQVYLLHMQPIAGLSKQNCCVLLIIQRIVELNLEK